MGALIVNRLCALDLVKILWFALHVFAFVLTVCCWVLMGCLIAYAFCIGVFIGFVFCIIALFDAPRLLLCFSVLWVVWVFWFSV